MKVYLAGMRDRCLRVGKPGWVHSSVKISHAQRSDLLQLHNKSWRGQNKGFTLLPGIYIPHKVVRLKK
jgi:hypothetical protein